jgi:hypothetical protein
MIRTTSVTLIFLLIIIGCKSEHSTGPAEAPNGKADLIIDTVSYTRLSDCFQLDPPEIVCGGPRFEFTLKIKNIGTADIASALFIRNSRSAMDFDSLYCSYGQRLNDPPAKIPVNGSLDIKLESDIEDSVQNILFVIDTNDRYNTGLTIPKIEELDYTNNSYVQPLSW